MSLIDLVIVIFVFIRVGSFSCLQNCSCQNFGQSGYYVACSKSNYLNIFQNLPNNVTLLRIKNSELFYMEAYMFSRFTNLTDLLLDENSISRISEEAFRNATKISRISLAGNNLKEFPWKSINYLPNLTALDLTINHLTSLPGRDNILMKRLNELVALNLFPNHHMICSCDTVAFAHRLLSWEKTSLNKNEVVRNWKKIQCTSINGFIKTDFDFLSKSELFKQSQCIPPTISIIFNHISNSNLLWNQILENSTHILNETTSFSCVVGNRTSLDELSIKVKVLGNELVIGSFQNFSSPKSYITIDPKFYYHKSKVICSVEDFSGNYSTQIYITKSLKAELDSNSPPVTTDQTFSVNNASIDNQYKEKVFNSNMFNEICGQANDFQMAIISMANTSKTSFEYRIDKELVVFVSLHKEHSAIDLELVRSNIQYRQMTICHTFGPRMLRVLLRKRKKRQLYSIKINSHDSNFIVCVILPQDKHGVCGEFVVQITSTKSSFFVMFIVGGFLLGLGVVPLAVATSYHVWDKRQLRSREKSFEREDQNSQSTF